MKLFPTVLLLSIVLVFIFSTGCRKDKFLDSGQLEFSTDTLTFDTVFTTLGSTTNYFKVFNKHKQKINISSVTLGGGSSSNFRINVDGVSADEVSNVEIGAEDSIYIFVEVTVDPNGINTPLVILDSVVFITNGNMQRVILEAWGQDAHFYNDTSICGENWFSDKPYVILEALFIDSGCVLTINEGVQVYFGGGAGIVVNGTSQIQVKGLVDQPVVFQGIRMEEFYEDLPGQWSGIFIFRGSTGNKISNAVIKNATYGISVGSARIDSCSNFPSVFNPGNAPGVMIENTIIKNNLANGISGFLSNIDAKNCLVFNSGDYLVSLALGGQYNFNHCTFVNYGSVVINHQKPSLLLSNLAGIRCNGAAIVYTNPLDTKFENTILYGSLENEIEWGKDSTTAFNFTFDHCLLRTELNTNGSEYINVIKNEDPLFTDNDEEDDYTLSENSPCINAGKVTSVMDDLAGKARDGQPDIGAYEF